MNWIVEIPSGVANGPFNIKAVMELIKVGEVAPNSKLTHRHTNEIVTVTADEAIAGGAHVSRAEEDLEHNRATGEEELTAQLREAQSASERSAAQHDLVAAELEQMRLQSTDEREALTAKMKDFQSRQIQLQHENEGLTQRLDQQRKFYDNEREQRRLREQELQQIKKVLQESLEGQKQKDRLAAQQHKIDEDALTRSRQHEERLAARLDQIQTAYAGLLNRQAGTPAN